jgi:hypothetical protein
MKSPATIIATAALVVALGGNATVYKINQDQQDTAELAARTAVNTNRVLCNQRETVQAQYDEAAAFLLLSPEQRVAKYGPILGAIPESVVETQQASRRAQLAVLRELVCIKEG